MTQKPASSYTVEITEEQRNLVLNGLVEKLLDTKRYISSATESNQPGPLDSCCEAHLQRYELRREMHRTLKQTQEAIEVTINLFSVEVDREETDGQADDNIREHE